MDFVLFVSEKVPQNNPFVHGAHLASPFEMIPNRLPRLIDAPTLQSSHSPNLLSILSH